MDKIVWDIVMKKELDIIKMYVMHLIIINWVHIKKMQMDKIV